VTVRIHPTARIEDQVSIGEGTAIWDHVHVRGPSSIGSECIVGEKTYIAYGVTIGDRVKINAFVYVCTGVTIEEAVMVAAGTIFTNDRYPRAATPDFRALRSSEPDDTTLPTRVRAGATIGARCVIGCGLTVGFCSMVGMASVVTRSVPDFHLVAGQPARSIGCVCRCGEPFLRFSEPELMPRSWKGQCGVCGIRYEVEDGGVRELTATA